LRSNSRADVFSTDSGAGLWNNHGKMLEKYFFSERLEDTIENAILKEAFFTLDDDNVEFNEPLL
jgi:hypothetical protein